MKFGIPLEIRNHENRVGAAPFLVEELVKRGHEVLVETKAGEMSYYLDEAYELSGATIVPSPEKLYSQAEFILKVREPMPVEYDLIRPEHVIFAYFHLILSNVEMSRSLLARGCSCYAYELYKNKDGISPMLNMEEQIIGQMGVQQGAYYLQSPKGGRGVLLGSVSGVSPVQVTILGATPAGMSAASYAATLGANVALFDEDYQTLQNAKEKLPANVNTFISHEQNYKKKFSTTDLLISAIQKKEDKAALVLTRETVKLLPKGAVLVDLAIDYGGSAETSKPTTHENPTFTIDGIIHYCVPNLAGAVPGTASEALSSALLPLLVRFMENGFLETLKNDKYFASGLTIYEGRVTHPRLAKELNVSLFHLTDDDQ